MKALSRLTLLVLACGACDTTRPTTPRATVASDALLLEVSPAEQARIATAREACDRAEDAYAAARAHATQVRDTQIGADLDLEIAATKVARATAEVQKAAASGTTETLAQMRRELQAAQAEHDQQAAAAKLCSKQTDHARALAEIAKEHVTVSEARVELAKAKAVNTLARPRGQMPSLPRFEESVRRAEADENLARTRAEATQKEVDVSSLPAAGSSASPPAQGK